MMKRRSRSDVNEPTMMIHHIREIQIRLLIVGLMLVFGMAVGFLFHEALFAFIKAPLNGPLHYTSPSGSFTFIINICLLIGVITALPVLVYNMIMFAQPALEKHISRARVYMTAGFSLLFAIGGGAFAFFVIIPLALRFFYKFKVDGLIALISADDYLHFVVNVIITFVLIFQLPLLISLFDHIKPLPPKKLLKAEKYIILGSIVIAIIVPFAVDPLVQFLIASPIVILYNISIGVVLFQRYMRARTERIKRSKNVRSAMPVVKTEPLKPILKPVGQSAAIESVPIAGVHGVRKGSAGAIVAPVKNNSLQAQRRRVGMQDVLSAKRPVPTSHARPTKQFEIAKKQFPSRPSGIRVASRTTNYAPRLIFDIRPLPGNTLGIQRDQ